MHLIKSGDDGMVVVMVAVVVVVVVKGRSFHLRNIDLRFSM